MEKDLHRLIRRELQDLGVTPPLDVHDLCVKLSRRRGRPLFLRAAPLPKPGPSGMWAEFNRDQNTWEYTNSQGFTTWMRAQDQTAQGNLRKIIRLMKFLRDHKGSFTGTRSVILTTLLANQVHAYKKFADPGYYQDVPTALLHIVGDLATYLQANESKPSVADPSGSGVTFDHRWEQNAYSYFRDRIHKHAAEIHDAYHAEDKDTSVRLWQGVFGPGFKAPSQQPVAPSSPWPPPQSPPWPCPVAPGEQQKEPPRTDRLAVQALADLHEAAAEQPDVLRLVGVPAPGQNGALLVTLRLHTGPLATADGGSVLQEHEEFVLALPASPLSATTVEVAHWRFAGYPHVLQGRQLCIFLDPAREWDPVRGSMRAYLNRLWSWLANAAAGQFDASKAMYHAVGGVLHHTPGTPTLVVRVPGPDQRIQTGCLVARTEHRLDPAYSPPPGGGAVRVPVVTVAGALPLGGGTTFAALLSNLDDPPLDRLRRSPPQAPAQSSAILTTLAASAARNPEGSPQYLTLAVPHPAGGPPHLLGARLPAPAADALPHMAHEQGSALSIDASRIRSDLLIEWCPVSDEQPVVTTRRDDRSPIGASSAKPCMSGAAAVSAPGSPSSSSAPAPRRRPCPTPEQSAADYWSGRTTSRPTSDPPRPRPWPGRLRAINDTVAIHVHDGTLPDAAALAGAAVIIAATVSFAMGHILERLAAIEGPPVLAQVATDTRTGALGLLSVSASTTPQGPSSIDTAAGKIVLADPALELYHRLWQDTPSCGYR